MPGMRQNIKHKILCFFVRSRVSEVSCSFHIDKSTIYITSVEHIHNHTFIYFRRKSNRRGDKFHRQISGMKLVCSVGYFSLPKSLQYLEFNLL